MPHFRNRLATGVCTIAILVGAQPIAGQEIPDAAVLGLDELLSLEISSAGKYAQTTGEVAASVTILTKEDIWAYGWMSLAEALANVRGMYITNDRNYTYLGNRGFSRPTDYNNRSLLLVNGRPMNEPFYGSAFIGSALGLNLQAVERIEIIRGPGSAIYGNNAMFNVINLVTEQPDAIGGLRLSGEAASFGTRSGSLTLGTSAESGVEVMVTANYFESEGQDFYFPEFDGPQGNDGLAVGLDRDMHVGGYGVVKFGDLSLTALATWREKDVPTAPYETLFNELTNTHDDRYFAELKYDRESTGPVNLVVRAFYDGYSYDGYYPYDENSAGGLWEDHNDVTWFGGEATLRWDYSASNRLLVGTEIRTTSKADYYFSDEAGDFFEGDFPFSIYSLFVQDELQLTHNVSVTAGGRVDHYTNSGSAFMPRAALVYHPSESGTAKLLYGRAFRAPNLYELNYEEADYWEANPDLQDERIETFELVWEQRLAPGVYGTASLFRYSMSDLIEEELGRQGIFQYQNRGAVGAEGIELEVQVRDQWGISGYASFVYQNATDDVLDMSLTNSPKYLVRAGMAFKPQPWLTTAVNLRYDSQRMSVWEDMVDSFMLTDLTLSTSRLNNRFRGFLKVSNLFDSQYSTPGGWEHEQSAIAQNGREIRLVVEVRD
ncbi:MAG: TonB-dependent receptor [Gemmatimonadota bacterium]|nr:TonB-dependent receptor [Gemmatimonadota bacterium]